MLKKIFSIFSPSPKKNGGQVGPHRIEATDHPLRPEAISPGARKVVEVLEDQGYQAFVVGGCVRDMLLNLHPKDFDVATNATPEEVKALFRRAHLIGKRFRIVHVHIGREMIEVTTFRGDHSGAKQSDQGMLLRDNVFGDIDEDARRRDFTANALYYHPRDNTIYDYANGLEAIRKRQLISIGDPATRYREDPVRMLRAARFAAKLGFTINPTTAQPIGELAHLLREVPPARLFDEVLKLFLSGHALATFQQLREYRLLAELFPQCAPYIDTNDSFYTRFIEQAIVNTDKRIRNNQRVTPAFLLAALLWPAVVTAKETYQQNNEHPAAAMEKAGGQVIARQQERIAIPRRFTMPMRDIWNLQVRLPNRGGRRAEHLVSLPRFRAAYDFVLLREQAGEDLGGLGQWWTRYQDADEATRLTMASAMETKGRRRSRRRRPART